MGTVRLLGVAGGVGAGGQRTVVGDPEVSQVLLVSRVVLDVSRVVAAATSTTAIVPAVRPRVFAGVDSRYLVVARLEENIFKKFFFWEQ